MLSLKISLRKSGLRSKSFVYVPSDSLHTSFTVHPQLILAQSLLPDILEKAYDSKEGAKTTPIVIWGVTLDPNGKKDARASVVLMKWLRAR